MDDIWLIIGIGFFIIFIAGKKALKKDKDGRIQDESVTIDILLSEMKDFKVETLDRLKLGYTEKSIQKQLDTYLKMRFVNVVTEYGIESLNGLKIDFDIGKGKVGIELKLANSLFKSTGLQRLTGQLEDYIEGKYNEKNLIVYVFGEEHHQNDRTVLEKIENKITSKGVRYQFFLVPTKTISES
jgi:hypothetical protein